MKGFVMYTYSIVGDVTYNDAETEDGMLKVKIDETVEIKEKSTEKALEVFFEENNQYEFYGSLKTVDAETYGKKGATYRDQNENQTIDVDLIES